MDGGASAPADGPAPASPSAEGRARLSCTPSGEQWEVQATTQGSAVFEEGPAIVVALAVSSGQGHPDDSHQWLVNVNLVGE